MSDFLLRALETLTRLRTFRLRCKAEERSQNQMELHTYELLQIHSDDDDDATTVMMRCRCPNSKVELKFRIYTFSTNVKRFKTLNDKLQHKSLVSRMEMHELLVRPQTREQLPLVRNQSHSLGHGPWACAPSICAHTLVCTTDHVCAS